MRSDAELLSAADTDAGAFRELYDRHARRVHDFFLHRTGSREAALDLTAETFAQAWYSRHRFKDRRRGSAAPWLFGIARKVLYRSIRTRRLAQDAVQRLGIVLAVDREHVRPEHHWADGMEADIERALGALPTEQRRAIELRVNGALPYQAVAAELGCSPGAARIRVSRGLSSLRTRLKGRRA